MPGNMDEIELNFLQKDNNSYQKTQANSSRNEPPKRSTLYNSMARKLQSMKNKRKPSSERKFVSYAARKASENKNRKSFSQRMNPTLLTMQVFTFYPATPVQRTHTTVIMDYLTHRHLYIGLLACVAIVFNLYIFYYNIGAMIEMVKDRPPNSTGSGDFTEVLLDAYFISMVINCQKPLIMAFNLLIFIVGYRKHKRLLKTLNVVDNALYENFWCSPNVECLNICFIVLIAITLLTPFTLRVVQARIMGEKLGRYWFVDFSFVLVPLWSVGNLLPLYYFEALSRVIRFWCGQLRQFIKENYEVSFEPRPLKFYYMKFVEIINVQVALGKFFGPFLLWSLSWSVFTLALAIYFATQTTSIIPVDMPEEQKMAMYFIIAWSSIQISCGAFNILVICISGTATNEAMRSVLAAVQDIVTEVETEDDKFQLVGLITTYALVLLELKSGDSEYSRLSRRRGV